MNQYAWIVYTGGLFSFIASMGIGTNDVANSFATSVGAKSLTIKQAVILACIFETSGAILMGSHVSETIRKGIANYECFQNEPYTLMYGCMWVCFSVASWLFTASYLEMPVSTTHSCIGGMIGMTIAIKGGNCVIWYTPKNTFPYVGGVLGMVLSWFISPLLSALISSSLYGIIRITILRKKYEDKYIFYAFPLLVGITMLLNSFFIFYKGAKGIGLDDTPLGVVVGISFGIGILSGLLTIPALPKIYNSIDNKHKNAKIQVIDLETNSTEIVELVNDTPKTLYDKIINVDINTFDKVEDKDLDIINTLSKNAEEFDPRTEDFFKYLQIFSASCAAFSHGANDVANAIGPFAAILTIYWEGDVRKNSVMDNNAYWILSLGGVGISLGLLLYGYKIIRAIGLKLCKITPSRGTIIELSAALVTILGSRLKIPLSTTHCQVGATCGVGLLESSWKDNVSGVNKKIIYKTMFGWIVTCIFVGIVTGIL
ncbi:inorganic phosphate transporter, partial [archaeon]|nr:inorganic phosphate transporter [archaeon]NDB56258.1 inorganic phosphate transporter [archaeon]NDB80195.1 inorganic phosphate transporter [archaeon]